MYERVCLYPFPDCRTIFFCRNPHGHSSTCVWSLHLNYQLDSESLLSPGLTTDLRMDAETRAMLINQDRTGYTEDRRHVAGRSHSFGPDFLHHFDDLACLYLSYLRSHRHHKLKDVSRVPASKERRFGVRRRSQK